MINTKHRWSAPDPYGQFHSPYLAMGNNPVSNIDPDGGYTNNASSGYYAAHWASIGRMQRAADDYLRFLGAGKYSQEAMYESYKEKFENLATYVPIGAGLESGGTHHGAKFLNAVYELNNEYIGMGLAAERLGTGIDKVSLTTRVIHSSLVDRNNDQNGSTVAPGSSGNGSGAWIDKFDANWITTTSSEAKDRALGKIEAWHKEADERKKAKEKAEAEAKKFLEENGVIINAMAGVIDFSGQSPNHGGVCSVTGGPPGALAPLANALKFAGGASLLDGPLPFGEIVGGLAIIGAGIYVLVYDPKSAGVAARISIFVATGGTALYDSFGKVNGKGERNWAGKADGSENPWKKLRQDPKNPNNVTWKDRDGKSHSKPKPPGWTGKK